MAKMTIRQVEAIKTPGKHSLGDGLILRIKRSGARSWIARIQVDGRRRDLGLGSAADVTLADAYDGVAEKRKLLRFKLPPQYAPIVPASVAVDPHPPIDDGPTFAVAAREAYAELKPGWKNKGYAKQWMRLLELYAFPIIGNRLVAKIGSADVRDVLVKVWLSKPETARRLRMRVETVLDWSHSAGYRDAEAPRRATSKGLPRRPKRDNHYAALPYDEIYSFTAMLGESIAAGKLALRFLVHTAARSGEVRLAKWSEIDFVRKLWIIPVERMKGGKQHVVPLTDAALEVLRLARRGADEVELDAFIFAAKEGRALSDMTLTQAVKKSWKKAKVTVHGFRSTFRDWAAEQTDYPSEVAEAALAHAVPNKVEAAYRRTSFLAKRRNMMEMWSEFIERGVAKEDD